LRSGAIQPRHDCRREREKGTAAVLPLTDSTMQATEYALHGLAERGAARASNIANVNTPFFRASRVDFEGALQRAMEAGDVTSVAAPSVVPGDGLPDALGNTVDLETEFTNMMKDGLMLVNSDMMKDGLLRSAMVNAFNFKVDVLRAAIGGR
jgi:flagellar basal-body rod protein FlgB